MRPNVRGGLASYRRANAESVQMNIGQNLLKGGVPPNLLGLSQGGSSIFSGIAHRVAQTKKLQNLVDNAVDQEVFLTVKGGNDEVVTTPFMFNGKQYTPNALGQIRIANNTNVKLAMEIRKYQEDKTDRIMEMIVHGDDIACFVLGIKPDDWREYTRSGGIPAGENVANWGAEFNNDAIRNQQCDIEYIESLVDGSIMQTKALSKLRKIVKCYLNNVNLEDFDTPDERKSDMNSGKNNPGHGLNPNGVGGEVVASLHGTPAPGTPAQVGLGLDGL